MRTRGVRFEVARMAPHQRAYRSMIILKLATAQILASRLATGSILPTEIAVRASFRDSLYLDLDQGRVRNHVHHVRSDIDIELNQASGSLMNGNIVSSSA